MPPRPAAPAPAPEPSKPDDEDRDPATQRIELRGEIHAETLDAMRERITAEVERSIEAAARELVEQRKLARLEMVASRGAVAVLLGLGALSTFNTWRLVALGCDPVDTIAAGSVALVGLALVGWQLHRLHRDAAASEASR